jgi:hypothetical protein
MVPALTIPPPKLGVLLMLRPMIPASTVLFASMRMPPARTPVSLNERNRRLLVSEKPPGLMVPVLAMLDVIVEFVKLSCGKTPALVQPTTVALLVVATHWAKALPEPAAVSNVAREVVNNR